MRKIIGAVIAATVLFAVGAFAASFAVNSEDIASGSDVVTACADLVDVDFTTVYDDVVNDGDWNVTAAVLTFYDNTGSIETPNYVPTSACGDYGASIAVGTGTDSSAAVGEERIPSGASTVTITLAPQNIKASAVSSAAVLVDGEDLQTSSAIGGF